VLLDDSAVLWLGEELEDGAELLDDELELGDDDDEELLDELLLEDSDCDEVVVEVWQALSMKMLVSVSNVKNRFSVISISYIRQRKTLSIQALSSACGINLSRYKFPKLSHLAHHSGSINVVAFFSKINAGPFTICPGASCSR
jgi:hypothetical protein